MGDILLDMVLPLDMELVLDMVLSLDMELVLDMVLSLDMDLVLDMVLPTSDRNLMEIFKILFILGHNHPYEHQRLKYRKSVFTPIISNKHTLIIIFLLPL